MNCPECGQGFSIVAGNTVHGERVRRLRCCVSCKKEWATVEITLMEHKNLERMLSVAEESRRQIARLWKEGE